MTEDKQILNVKSPLHPPHPNPLPKGERVKGWWKPVALISTIIGIMILAKVFGLGQRLEVLRGWIQGLGNWGMVVFVLIYVIGVVAALPGSALTVAAGALFGSVKGVILVSIAATTGASLSFLIARYFAREAAARWLSGKESFRKLDQLTRERGAIIVALTRLVPIFPFNLLNYGFGLTQVPFKTYVFWSWLCMLPGTVLYVVGTDVVVKAVTQGRIPWALISAMAIAGGILAVLVKHARRKIQGDSHE